MPKRHLSLAHNHMCVLRIRCYGEESGTATVRKLVKPQNSLFGIFLRFCFGCVYVWCKNGQQQLATHSDRATSAHTRKWALLLLLCPLFAWCLFQILKGRGVFCDTLPPKENQKQKDHY